MTEPIEFEMKRVPVSFFTLTTKPCQVCGEDATYYSSESGNFCHPHIPKPEIVVPEEKEIIHFEGTCDVCGETLTMDFSFTTDGIIDHIGGEDGKMITWRRHGPEGPVQPDCNIYSSRVYEKSSTVRPLTEEEKATFIRRRESDWW